MVNPVLDTLFLPLASGQMNWPEGKTLFMNAQACAGLDGFNPAQLTAVQWFKPYAEILINQGFTVDVAAGSPDGSSGGSGDDSAPEKGVYAAAFVLGTKSRIETEIYLARAVSLLAEGAMLIVAAGNKEGAGRLKKMLVDLGFEGVAESVKNKARVCWAAKNNVNDAVLRAWLAQDGVREIAGGFVSRPGIYGWEKIDKGSELLAAHLPRDLKGNGADFGCGYGYLGRAVLETNRKAKSLDSIDADARALAVCAQNLAGFDVKKQERWLDLAAPRTGLENCYDWIVMNPPFHEGKKTDSDIGVAFIKNAYAALRRKGALYMVANNQLPYERVLTEMFWETQLIAQGGGFKAFRAVK